jgi:dolichol-phosphate mannosyltransferase
MSDSIVIIPTYNEKENIEKIIRAVFGLEKQFDILVIDDGSPDGTAAIVKGLMANEFAGRLHILERSGKLGLGTAYIMGFKWSLKQGYDFIFEMDADFSHDPNDLPRLYAATHDEGYDVAVGSRYISGVNVVNWPIGRVLMSYFASKYVRIVTGFKVNDTTAGFVCYRRKVLETIDLDAIRVNGLILKKSTLVMILKISGVGYVNSVKVMMVLFGLVLKIRDYFIFIRKVERLKNSHILLFIKMFMVYVWTVMICGLALFPEV